MNGGLPQSPSERHSRVGPLHSGRSVELLLPAKAGFLRDLVCIPQSCDWGYLLSPAKAGFSMMVLGIPLLELGAALPRTLFLKMGGRVAARLKPCPDTRRPVEARAFSTETLYCAAGEGSDHQESGEKSCTIIH